MNYYIYYSPKTNHNGGDDVAAVRAASLDDAMEIFKKYFKVVKSDSIRELNFEQIDEDSVADIIILSDY